VRRRFPGHSEGAYGRLERWIDKLGFIGSDVRFLAQRLWSVIVSWVRAAEQAKRAEAERKAVADAQKTVAIWNVRQAGGRALWFYPTIGAAIAPGLPWLSFSCPACRQRGSVDLRTLDRPRWPE
jgi:hypothetical protein